MPRERKQRGHKHTQKRKLEREEEEKKYIQSQERDVLFYDRPKNPFGLLTREDEKFFFEVYDEFKRNEWDDEDAKEAFMRNVFVEMRGKELKIATSQVGKFLEMLLVQCPRSEIKRIMTVFKGHARELARHRFGSFALEKIAGHVGVWISKDIEGIPVDEEPEEEQFESFEKLFMDMMEELLYPEMHELFTDPFAAHVYQAFLHTLSGHPLKNLTDGRTAKKRKIDQDNNTLVQTPASFGDLLEKLVTLVKQWNQDLLRTMVFDKYAVPLFQMMIEIDLPKRKKSKGKAGQDTLSDLILFGKDSNAESAERQEFINRLLRDSVGSRIIESILRVASAKTIQTLFVTYFTETLSDLAIDSSANFAVQRVLGRLNEPEDITFVVKQLLPLTSKLIENSRVSVVTAVIDACARTNVCCEETRKIIYEQLLALPHGKDNLWSTLMTFDNNLEQRKKQEISQDSASSEKYPVSRFGALFATSILNLPRDTDYRLIEDLCKQETDAVLFYMTSPKTSHVVESMLSSKFPVPVRRKLLNHVLGSVVSLSKDPAGSHIIDACWDATQGLKYYREKIAKEMADHVDDVRSDYFGKRVWRNWNMDGYVGGRFDWGRQAGTQDGQFAKRPVVKEKSWQRRRPNETGRSTITAGAAQ